MRIVGLIPARGGSKGVPRKNIRSLHGRPLLAYTADVALASKALARVIVSTEDAEVASVARSLGLEVINRPQHLAEDTTPTLPVVDHVLDKLEASGESFDAVCLLQPTHPLREVADIDAAVRRLTETGADSVVSFVDVGGHHPSKMKQVDDAGRVSDLPFAKPVEGMRRQDLPPVFLIDGSIYLTRTEVLRRDRSFQGRDCRALLIPPERACNVDTELDLIFAECLLARRHRGQPRSP